MKNKKEPKWFKKFKTNRHFKRVENRIEVAKYIFDKDIHITEWIIGIGLVIFLSVSITNAINSPIQWIRILAFVLSSFSLITLFIAIILHVMMNNRQRRVMIYLYLLKDKQEIQGKKYPKKNKIK